MRILIPLHGFIRWNGGLDLVRLLIAGIESVHLKWRFELAFALPSASVTSSLLNSTLRRLRIHATRAGTLFSGGESSLLLAAKEIAGSHPTISCADSSAGILSAARDWNADIIFPTMSPLGPRGPKRVGYLFDFQHRYLPDLFSARTRWNRDRKFRAIVADSCSVVVNSSAVREDLVRFLGVEPNSVLTLPFCPHAQPWWFQGSSDEIKKKYRLHCPFLMISNHFWKHKDHATALRAFALVRQQVDTDLHLVLTGDPVDHRDPRHFGRILDLAKNLGIEDETHFLGLIPKSEQLSLMRTCEALVQPTQFEGGPGGGAVYEAIGLGVPAVVSDILVNREINQGNVTFFRVGDPVDLATKIVEVLSSSRERPDPEELVERGATNLVRLGDSIGEHLARLMADDY